MHGDKALISSLTERYMEERVEDGSAMGKIKVVVAVGAERRCEEKAEVWSASAVEGGGREKVQCEEGKRREERKRKEKEKKKNEVSCCKSRIYNVLGFS